MPEDAAMEDAEDVEGSQAPSTQRPPVKLLVESELDEKYPNRPRNHSRTLPFHDLFQHLFNPLNDNKKKPTGPVTARKKQGPHGPANLNPQELRRAIIERFISRWRKEVGDDIFPAFRLILPEKDRERAMYGLKEKTIAKLLVRVIKIDKNSEDGYNLLNWKLPGQKTTSVMAGDFSGRCHEVLSKRSMRTQPGDMTIEEVNDLLDQLSVAGKENDQLPIFQEFYQRMNAEEMTWLVRMILKQMKIGATEKTILNIWHPDAETLFNISSNLRRVCWELYDPDIRLEGEETDITLMQTFQPQLAQFQEHHFDRLVRKMRPTDDDAAFWIEEKLDGERMQLHMIEDTETPGGKRFGFWSRKAKDYTYLYGNGFQDENSALTRHLREAFDKGVRNIILDGEMITWDPESDLVVPFGTLKSAALSEQKNPFGTGERPLYRVFDILYLNDTALTSYTLRDRRRALESAVKPVHRRLELHTYTEATTAADIEPRLRQVVAEASEGLVLKNPRSMYRLNERNDDWIKVKPEYMAEYGEELDCLVIGGYYGSGRRGGNLSSFLCGLRVDQPTHGSGSQAHSQSQSQSQSQTPHYPDAPPKFWSFFKVGGGFSASDYSTIRHRTEGLWTDWDPKHPPLQHIELGGGHLQYERPDVWILPISSFVISVKAASVGGSPQFRTHFTLRFPRFRALRLDKDWKSCLTLREFLELKNSAEKEKQEKQFIVDDANKKKRMRNARAKKPLVIAGTDANINGDAEEAKFKEQDATNVFAGLTFFVASESLKPKMSKPELEKLIKKHGGKIIQTAEPKVATEQKPLVISDRNTVPIASLKKKNIVSIIRPVWVFDCIEQAKRDMVYGYQAEHALPLPYEPARHVFFACDGDEEVMEVGKGVDEYGDAFARDIGDVGEMRGIVGGMPVKKKKSEGGKAEDDEDFMDMLREKGIDVDALPGWLFKRCVVWFLHSDRISEEKEEEAKDATNRPPLDVLLARNLLAFGGGQRAKDGEVGQDRETTHVVVSAEGARKAVSERIKGVRAELAKSAV